MICTVFFVSIDRNNYVQERNLSKIAESFNLNLVLVRLILLVIIGVNTLIVSDLSPVLLGILVILLIFIFGYYVCFRNKENMLWLTLLLLSNIIVLQITKNILMVIFYFFFPVNIFAAKPKWWEYTLFSIHAAGFITYAMVTNLSAGFSNTSVSAFVYSIFGYVGVVSVEMIIYKRRTERARLKLLNDELIQKLIREKEYLVAEERKNISQHLHDSMGHSLMALLLNVRYLKVQNAKGKGIAETELCEMEQMIKDSVEILRGTVDDLKRIDNEIQLEEELTRLAAQFNRLEMVGVTVAYDKRINNVKSNIKNALFQTVCEGVTNAIKHGDVTKIEISILEKNGFIVLIIADNGKGAKNISPSHGLNGIRERTEALGGSTEFTGSKGFCIICKIPAEETR